MGVDLIGCVEPDTFRFDVPVLDLDDQVTNVIEGGTDDAGRRFDELCRAWILAGGCWDRISFGRQSRLGVRTGVRWCARLVGRADLESRPEHSSRNGLQNG